ncbi:EfeM/EfeO family lipoprotein [Actinoplanes sp. KI2]|uniref:EfeM/EfeO family lipoprotein n=1 Tax=Actinoplanes sp. KI2 TaxID=2983315 RepID=UPI0021D58439|nr:EfeM/EfeO family lipoprotein [Actinoplanes sp. KI2]MCU7729122.1 EfeM/EfeO family lipoprotein [Actinoplanes sp. KI2]
MTRFRVVLLAATTAVVAAAGALVLARSEAATPVPTEPEARALIDNYRTDSTTNISETIRYAEAVSTTGACTDPPGTYTISARYSMMPPSAAAGATAVDALRTHWADLGYRVVTDVPGQNSQLLAEDPATGFRVGISRRTAGYLRLAVSSPCLTLPYPPAPPVLPQEQASVREAYQQYVGGVLDRLTGDVAALRAAVAGSDRAKARSAWLTAQLTWDRVGAAYGSFGEYADAVDGLPQGLPGGVRDPHFTGLRRIEYGLWHGAPLGTLLPLVDAVAGQVTRLRGDLAAATPDAIDLPPRVPEILEDALRFHRTGLTDMGAGSGLAETAAAVDATAALLDLFGPLLDERRPALRPAAYARLENLRHAIAVRRDVDAALGGVLETLAQAPGLLEVTGS